MGIAAPRPDEAILMVGDILLAKKPLGDGNRVWRVTSIQLGGIGEESAVGIESLDRRRTGPLDVPADMLDEAIRAGAVEVLP